MITKSGGNGDSGITLDEAPCNFSDKTFTGFVEDGANTFGGNGDGPVCPVSWPSS